MIAVLEKIKSPMDVGHIVEDVISCLVFSYAFSTQVVFVVDANFTHVVSKLTVAHQKFALTKANDFGYHCWPW